MYYILYALLKLFSLLPLPLLYLISDGLYIIIYHVVGYRKKVVIQNLSIAFPEKSEEERRLIMKSFYRNFTDSFAEIIKLFSWSNDECKKRFTGNIEMVNQFAGGSQNLYLVSGHFFNWEIANRGLVLQLTMPFIGVYMPLSNQALNRIFYDMRKKAGTLLVSATNFAHEIKPHLKNQYLLALVGDQNAGNPARGRWVNFFGKPVPVVKGPEAGAKANNAVLVFANFYKIKRGYYHFNMELITKNPAEYSDGALTRIFMKKIEAAVKERPANYLWTHRRWKHNWNADYGPVIE